MDDIRNIIFKDINADYAYGQYGDFEVIMMRSNGYVNATKLCKDATTRTGAKKEFFHWTHNESRKGLMDALAASLAITRDAILITPNNLPNKLRGTYAHPDIICHIASWASHDFAIRVSRIVNQYFVRKIIEQSNRIIEEKNIVIKEKEDKIDKLSNKLDKYTVELKVSQKELRDSQTELKNSQTELKKSRKELKESNSKADNLIKQNNVILRENKNIHKKLAYACNDRVKHTGNDADKNLLVVIKTNEEGHYEYTVLRVSAASKQSRIKQHKSNCLKSKIVVTLEAVPNAIIMWKNIVKHLTDGENAIIGSRMSNNFDLCKDVSEETMIDAFREVSNMKFDIIDDDED